MDWQPLIAHAVSACKEGIRAGQSPFAAVIADARGRVVSAAHNTVRATCDPTAHAEVNAIRKACATLGRIELSGHVMFTTCEPCPMCAAAIHWARLDALAWGATIAHAQAAGFNELSLGCADLYTRGGSGVRIQPQAGCDCCAALFDLWRGGPNPEAY